MKLFNTANSWKWALLLGVMSIASSCSNDQPVKASSTGSPSELLVVAENNLWKSSLGDSVRSFFDGPVPALPQPEPLYRLVNVKEDEFGRVLKIHRNVLILTIDSSMKQPVVETRRDVWAAPQSVVKVSAASLQALKATFAERKNEFLNFYDNSEIERLHKLYSKSLNLKAAEALKENFNLSMNIPADYYLAKEKDNFLWFRREANKLSQGILIYTYPYTDTVAFQLRKIKSVRNQFTELYVPGPSDSSYMIIADEYMDPIARTLRIKKNLATEVRGLWEVRKDFMGGPFISYTLVDTKNNRVITLDGYVYAPGERKHDLLKQVQAILLSFEFIEQ